MKESARKTRSLRRAPRSKVAKEVVVFEYFDPSANIVTVTGDFNEWSQTARPMKRDAGGLWKVKVRLDPGSYQYKFVVNGERWEEDPLNLRRVINEHGTYNSIRKVGTGPDDLTGSV
jgi:1,4-alpha-glucan branching enzyme